MQGQNQSYLDLSVLKDLRKHVLSQDAVVVFNDKIDRIIWANAIGAELFGGRGVVDLLSATITDSQSIVRQLKDSIDQMDDKKTITRGFRVNQGLRSVIIQFEIKRIKLYENELGYKVTDYFDGTKKHSEKILAENAVTSLTDFADAAAILDDDGKLLSASINFRELGPSDAVLSTMVEELKNESDRLIKRPEITTSGKTIAIGLARLSNEPGRNLIVLAETQKETEIANVNPIEEASAIDQDDDLPEIEVEEIETDTSAQDVNSQIANELDTGEETFNFTPEPETEKAQPKTKSKYELEKNDGTVRFAWVIDENCVFKSVSPELEEVVGKNAAAVIGREWREVANVFGFDTNHTIEKLLKKQDTWSGRTVLWPVEGTDMVLPIDLAALPSFNSDREFEGFRGFGIIRSADALLDPDEIGLALDSPRASEIEKPQDTPDETAPAQTNIVRLVPRQTQSDTPRLSDEESHAFRKIGDTLREDDISKVTPIEANQKLAEAFPTEEKPQSNTAETGLPAEEVDENDGESVDVSNDDKSSSFSPAGLDTSIMENLPVPIVIYNSEEILFVNHSLLEASQYDSTQELEAAGGIETILSPVSDGEDGTPNYYLTTKYGKRTPINPVLHTVPWAGEKALLISFAKSKEPLHDEPPALEMSNVSEIQNILDITSDGILVLDHEGTIVSINASAEALFNISFDSAKNKNITTLFAAESRNSIRQYVESLSEPGIENLFDDGKEVIAAEANGGMIPVFLTISKMQSSGKLCAVIRDMTNWKKAEEELIQSRHEAENASSQKTDFLANISHEIRTPLNSIIGFSDIMIEERFGPIQNERYREYLRDINKSGNHVLALINDLLDLSKIESGKLELEFEAVDLNEMVAESVALLQPQANSNRIIIRTSLSRAVPKVVADTRSIRQIILNLVSNAIKFSPTNSQVIVSTVYESNGEVALRIRDTGNGMSETQIEDALKPFQQVHTSDDQRNEGTGLGLPLTKALVEANRALFDLESQPGQGTIAHVQFPTQRVLAD